MLALLLLFVIALSGQGHGMPVDCLSGNYTNVLGSTMQIEWFETYFAGFYQSAVGNAKGSYLLHGSATCECGIGGTLGFCVTWNNEENGNSNSTSCWTGQIIFKPEKPWIVLATTWILSTTPTEPSALWSSNQIGQDFFWQVSNYNLRMS